MKVKTKCLHFALLTITKSQQGRTKIVVFAETKIFGRIPCHTFWDDCNYPSIHPSDLFQFRNTFENESIFCTNKQ